MQVQNVNNSNIQKFLFFRARSGKSSPHVCFLFIMLLFDWFIFFILFIMYLFQTNTWFSQITWVEILRFVSISMVEIEVNVERWLWECEKRIYKCCVFIHGENKMVIFTVYHCVDARECKRKLQNARNWVNRMFSRASHVCFIVARTVRNIWNFHTPHDCDPVFTERGRKRPPPWTLPAHGFFLAPLL